MEGEQVMVLCFVSIAIGAPVQRHVQQFQVTSVLIAMHDVVLLRVLKMQEEAVFYLVLIAMHALLRQQVFGMQVICVLE